MLDLKTRSRGKDIGRSLDSAPHPKPIRGADPTIVSLTAVELARLLDIEAAAQSALRAITGPRSADDGELLAVAQALDVALHMPVFGG